MHIFCARLANFGHLGLISDPIIVLKFHNETQVFFSQSKKSNTIRMSCKTEIIQLPIYIQSQFTDMNLFIFLKFKIVGKPNFSDQFKKIIKRYKRVAYNMDIMQQSVCLVVNPITVYSYGFLFNCTTVGQASDSMMALT